MPPRIKVTKEDIINAAVKIVRKDGAQAVNARNLASALSCSTQPIFSNFATMDDLNFSVLKRIDEICQEYIQNEVKTGKYPSYKASGMAYIRFAKEEKELFKLLYMRDRTNETFPQEFELTPEMEKIIKNSTGLSKEDMKLFHLEMWAYVHGIATMFATDFCPLEWELVSKMLTDVYLGLKKQYGLE